MEFTRNLCVYLVFVTLAWIVVVSVADEEVVCRTCDCNRDLKTVRCNGRGLRFVPDLTWANAAVFSTIDLRDNEITFVDFNRLVKFRVINIQNNPISCSHGLINVRSITVHNQVYIDCEIPGVRTMRTPRPQDFISDPHRQTRHTDEPSTVFIRSTNNPTHQRPFENADTMFTGLGAQGEAEAYTKGKLELAWGVSTSLTICGLIGGLVTCYTLSKLAQRIKYLDMRMRRQDDFEAPRPNTPPRSLFEDITDGIAQAFTSSRERNTDDAKSDRQPESKKGSTSRPRYTQKFKDDETEDDDEDVETSFTSHPPPPPQPPGSAANRSSAHVFRHANNPFHTRFSPHEVCGLSDTLASFTLSGYREQSSILTEDESE